MGKAYSDEAIQEVMCLLKKRLGVGTDSGGLVGRYVVRPFFAVVIFSFGVQVGYLWPCFPTRHFLLWAGAIAFILTTLFYLHVYRLMSRILDKDKISRLQVGDIRRIN